MSALRKALGAGRLETRPPGYVLHVAPEELDLARFEALLETSRTVDPAEAARLLREALSLCRGSPLADLAYESFAQPHIARLEGLRLAALEARIDAELATGLHAELIGELDGLVLEHPLRERLRAQLMLALYRCGRQSDALAAYRDARRALCDELGLEPGAELQELQAAILRHDAALDLPRREAARPGSEPDSCILVFPAALSGLDALLELATAPRPRDAAESDRDHPRGARRGAGVGDGQPDRPRGRASAPGAWRPAALRSRRRPRPPTSSGSPSDTAPSSS